MVLVCKCKLSGVLIIDSFLLNMRYTLGEEEYVEFSKQDQDKLIATNAQVATVSHLQIFISFFYNFNGYFLI